MLCTSKRLARICFEAEAKSIEFLDIESSVNRLNVPLNILFGVVMSLENIAALLEKNDVVFDIKSATHWVVEGNQGYIDYWPTTGKWSERGTVVTGFGARLLVQYIVNKHTHDGSV